MGAEGVRASAPSVCAGFGIIKTSACLQASPRVMRLAVVCCCRHSVGCKSCMPAAAPTCVEQAHALRGQRGHLDCDAGAHPADVLISMALQAHAWLLRAVDLQHEGAAPPAGAVLWHGRQVVFLKLGEAARQSVGEGRGTADASTGVCLRMRTARRTPAPGASAAAAHKCARACNSNHPNAGAPRRTPSRSIALSAMSSSRVRRRVASSTSLSGAARPR